MPSRTIRPIFPENNPTVGQYVDMPMECDICGEWDCPFGNPLPRENPDYHIYEAMREGYHRDDVVIDDDEHQIVKRASHSDPQPELTQHQASMLERFIEVPATLDEEIPGPDAALPVVVEYVNKLWSCDCTTKRVAKHIRYAIGKALNSRREEDIIGQYGSWMEFIQAEFERIDYRSATDYRKFADIAVVPEDLDSDESFTSIMDRRGGHGPARQTRQEIRRALRENRINAALNGNGPQQPQRRTPPENPTGPLTASQFSARIDRLFEQIVGKEGSDDSLTKRVARQGLNYRDELSDPRTDGAKLDDCESRINGIINALNDLVTTVIKPAKRTLALQLADREAQEVTA